MVSNATIKASHWLLGWKLKLTSQITGNLFSTNHVVVTSKSEPSETLCIGIVLVKSRIFWVPIPGLGIGPVQGPKPRPVLVLVPFSVQKRDRSRYQYCSMSRAETGLGISPIKILGLPRF